MTGLLLVLIIIGVSIALIFIGSYDEQTYWGRSVWPEDAATEKDIKRVLEGTTLQTYYLEPDSHMYYEEKVDGLDPNAFEVVRKSDYDELEAKLEKLKPHINHRCSCPRSSCLRKVLSQEEYELGCRCGAEAARAILGEK